MLIFWYFSNACRTPVFDMTSCYLRAFFKFSCCLFPSLLKLTSNTRHVFYRRDFCCLFGGHLSSTRRVPSFECVHVHSTHGQTFSHSRRRRFGRTSEPAGRVSWRRITDVLVEGGRTDAVLGRTRSSIIVGPEREVLGFRQWTGAGRFVVCQWRDSCESGFVCG